MKKQSLWLALLPALFFALLSMECRGQAPNNDPATAFEEAIHPFEVIRHASQNWSDVERGAFTAARQKAKENCASIKTVSLSPEQLIAYARLCAFGDNWSAAGKASRDYLALEDSRHNAHDVSTAFDLEIQADLRLQLPDDAIVDSRTMLQTVPYNADVAEALDSAIGYLRFSDPEKALSLIRDRHPILLAQIAAARNPDDSREPSLNIAVSAMYAEALFLPAMLQYLNRPEDATAELETVQAKLPVNLSPHEANAIDSDRNRYLLLGKPLPALKPTGWLMATDGSATGPKLDATGQTTALLIFPDWCTQCLALRTLDAWKRLRADGDRFFTLLATDVAVPGNRKDGAFKSKSLNEQSTSGTRLAPLAGENPGIPHVDLQLAGDNQPISLLRGTPTFVIPARALQAFYSPDVPFVVVLDRHGFIRVVQAAGDNYLESGGALDQMIKSVNEKWPPQ